jgi:SNF2 family DNA or RNA helicase
MLSPDILHAYQKRIIKMSETTPHMGLFMDMGLGKTVTALTIVSQLNGATLIIGPKAVVKQVWRKEAANWKHTSRLKFALMVGTPAERLKALRSNSDVYLINVENVPWLFEQKNLPSWKNLIVDESSRFKNPSAKRWKSLKSALKSFDHRYILTGTPTPKSYLDLWCQVGILDLGQRLGKSMTGFKDKFFLPDARDRRTGIVWSWKLRPGAQQEIDALLADICVSLKAEDYLTMPARQDIVHKIEWDKHGKRVYDTMLKDTVVEVGDQVLTAVSAGVLTGKLLQITSGEIYDEDHNIVEVHEEKLDYLIDMLDETHTIIFYNFKHSLRRLQEAFPDAVVMDPDDMEMLGRWNRGEISKLLCHPKSAGIGLNMQCNVGDTSQIVWFDLPWSSEDYLQANARLYRQGQTKPVVIHHLCMEKSIDNQVMDVLQGKIDLQNALMNALKLK